MVMGMDLLEWFWLVDVLVVVDFCYVCYFGFCGD